MQKKYGRIKYESIQLYLIWDVWKHNKKGIFRDWTGHLCFIFVFSKIFFKGSLKYPKISNSRNSQEMFFIILEIFIPSNFRFYVSDVTSQMCVVDLLSCYKYNLEKFFREYTRKQVSGKFALKIYRLYEMCVGNQGELYTQRIILELLMYSKLI